jgi:glycosyltransferase involved in cell wall biosynthesis
VSAAGPEATAALAANHEELVALVAAARRHLDAGRLDAAAAIAQAAAQHAWMNHAGRFADPELEALLAELAARCAVSPAAAARPRREDPEDVLHVVTQCYQTGGSTREIACWLEQDAGRRHRVCVTRQGSDPTPTFLADRLRGPADLVLLDAARGGLMARAAALRALAATVDVVVLHVHPYDVVPLIAFAGVERPPVVLVNHADHVFWLGVGISDAVLHMRESGRRLAEARRGLALERSMVMARPLMPADRTVARDEAKRRLGLDPAAVVLATAADASKYRPVGADTFLGLVVPALLRHPEAILLAAGPSDAGPWAQAAARTDGRVRALGRLPDITLLHQAADVYLDSFPFSSLTSLLEAGSVGVPSITYRGHPADCGVLGADVPGVDPFISAPEDPAAYDAALERAIADPAWRHETGARTAEAIRATHTGAGWQADVDAVYRQAARMAAAGPPLPGPAPFAADRVDELVRDVMLQTGFAQGPDGVLLAHLGLLPLRQRASTAVRLARRGSRPTPRALVSEWLPPVMARVRRQRAVPVRA